jgi:hypothetical protein
VKKTVLATIALGMILVSSAFAQKRTYPKGAAVQTSDEADATAAAQSTTTGKFVFNFTIAISSPGISSGAISCQAAVDLVSSSSGLPYAEDDAAVKATITGSTGTCSVQVPYSWQVQSSQDYVVLNVGLNAGPSNALPSNLQLCPAAGSGCVSGLPAKISQKEVGTQISVPLSGSTTTKSVAFTL